MATIVIILLKSSKVKFQTSVTDSWNYLELKVFLKQEGKRIEFKTLGGNLWTRKADVQCHGITDLLLSCGVSHS